MKKHWKPMIRYIKLIGTVILFITMTCNNMYNSCWEEKKKKRIFVLVVKQWNVKQINPCYIPYTVCASNSWKTLINWGGQGWSSCPWGPKSSCVCEGAGPGAPSRALVPTWVCQGDGIKLFSGMALLRYGRRQGPDTRKPFPRSRGERGHGLLEAVKCALKIHTNIIQSKYTKH